MNVMELLVKSAQSNHGRPLEPAQVQELVAGFQAINQALMTAEGRLDAVTRIAGVLLERLGGKVRIMPEELDEFEQTPGFLVNWDVGTDVIYVETQAEEAPRLEVPPVQLEAEDAEASPSDGTPLPEGEGFPGQVDGSSPE
jgi:hypothetical protein